MENGVEKPVDNAQVNSEELVLQKMLCQHLGVSMTQVAVTRLAGDVSSRRYYRANFKQNIHFSSYIPVSGVERESSTRPREWEANSVILTVYPEPFAQGLTALEDLSNKLLINPNILLTYANSPHAQLEQTVFLYHQGLPVPRVALVQHQVPRWEGLSPVGLIVFEDFGDKRLLEVLLDSALPDRQEWYGRAVELIAQLHNTTEVVRRSALVANSLYFSSAKLEWELDFFINHYFNSFLKKSIQTSQLNALRHELQPLCTRLAQAPQVLCHRDYHARNLMVQDNRLFLIDYQDARLGPTTYDLVSLLLDPYAPTEGLDVPLLLHRYRAARQGSQPAVPDGDAFEQEWAEMAVQRLLKAAGTYAYMAGARGVPEFEGYLAPTLKRACELLQKLGGFNSLIEALS